MKRAFFIALLLLLPTFCLADTMQDAVTGNNSCGPFALSWKGIAPGTETVQIGGIAQARGIDYTIDADAGTVSFTRPLPANAVAAVRYDYDPARAVRVQNAPVIPLAVDLARAGQSSLGLTARLQTGFAQPQNGALVVGAQGGIASKAGSVNGHIDYAPALNGEAAGASDASRTSVELGAQAGGGPLSASAQFARAGQNAGADAPGTQTVTVRASASPLQTLSASGEWTQTAPLANDATGPVTTKTDAAITLTPDAHAQVSASVSDANAPGTASDTQSVTVQAAATPVSALSLTAQSTSARTGDAESVRRAASLSLSPLPALSLTAGAVGVQSAASQFTLTSVGGKMDWGRVLELSGAWRTRTAAPTDTAPADALDTGQARLALSPVPGLQLIGTFAQNPDDGTDFARALTQNGLGVETGVGALSLGGDWKQSRGADAAAQEQQLGVHMGLRLSAATQVSGSLTQTLAGADGAAAGTNLYTLGLSHALGDRVSLSLSGTAQTPAGAGVAASPDYTAKADLGLRF